MYILRLYAIKGITNDKFVKYERKMEENRRIYALLKINNKIERLEESEDTIDIADVAWIETLHRA